MMEVLLVGSGFMAKEYLKVLTHLNVKVTVVGRGIEKIEALRLEFPQHDYHVGGIKAFLSQNDKIFTHAINAVNVEFLCQTSEILALNKIENILIEKPGALSIDELQELKENTKNIKHSIYIGYNRRFYSSVTTLLNEVEKDGGIKNLHFEFTEWIHTIDPKIYHEKSLQKWIISNSSHVIDTAFYLIGFPKELNSYISGKNQIQWHPSGSCFTGSGISDKNIPFTYNCNWESAGRWAIEIFTNKRRFYLKPMEKLFVQQKGSIAIDEFIIDDKLDLTFKAGLHEQITSFLSCNYKKFVSLDEQMEYLPIYNKIGGY